MSKVQTLGFVVASNGLWATNRRSWGMLQQEQHVTMPSQKEGATGHWALGQPTRPVSDAAKGTGSSPAQLDFWTVILIKQLRYLTF